ncbi:hypothetical protein K503DRAFT_868279 [Rhizopogon vinicolor AM-OR11-026]|uniref:Wax synthase domain-containing protein n=1 Tax=Rhizopogon vinicolor AM-OR11-026 TaxID=1314800 RepID=A0A1B7MS47_9AGAM|nr:hypothetical protein K503DRAFT_868279 [Rhizopogon vinicolor AM-OR11-026]
MNLNLLPLICAQLPPLALQFAISLDLGAPWNVAACAGVFYVCWTCIQLFQNAKTGMIFLDYSIGMEIGSTAMDAIHMLLLIRPLHVFRQLKQTDSADKLPWFERFKWVRELCSSPRGIGWHHQVKNLPQYSAKSRTEIVLTLIVKAVKHYVWFDIGLYYMRNNAVFQSPAAFASQMLFRRLISCSLFLGTYFCMGIAAHSLIVALVVSCTSAEPNSWPSVFGKWEDAYTIRRFWGRTWHQMLRRYVAPFGKRLTSFIGFKSGTNGSSYTQLYAGFIASGATHLAADAVLNPAHIGMSVPFFIYQALAITFEDMVIAAAHRAGMKETIWTRVLGYVWVISWFIVTVPDYISALSLAGVETGGVVMPFQYLPPSLFGILINF